MPSLQNVVFLFTLLFSLNVFAGEWRAVLNRAGFLGTVAAGVNYEFNDNHALEYSLGNYPIDSDNFYQSNLIYRYSKWNTSVDGNMWRPLQFGFFMVYAMNQEKYFITSPDKYPYPKYYDETALRYGAEFGTTFTFIPSRFGFGYFIRVFDNGLIAAFNNSNRDLQYYVSSGFSLQYLF